MDVMGETKAKALIHDNYDSFMENRMDNGIYGGGGPGNIARRRAKVQRQIAEWQELCDPQPFKGRKKYSIFWLNFATNKMQWKEPDWAEEWRIKKARSKKIRVWGEWDIYFDPVSKLKFFHNFISDVFQFDKPEFKSNSDKKRGETSIAPDEGWDFYKNRDSDEYDASEQNI